MTGQPMTGRRYPWVDSIGRAPEPNMCRVCGLGCLPYVRVPESACFGCWLWGQREAASFRPLRRYTEASA